MSKGDCEAKEDGIRDIIVDVIPRLNDFSTMQGDKFSCFDGQSIPFVREVKLAQFKRVTTFATTRIFAPTGRSADHFSGFAKVEVCDKTEPTIDNPLNADI